MSVNAYSPLWFRLFMPMQTEESTRKDIAFLTRQLPLPHYRHVLDLCCGYGRHVLGLAEQGYRVTGVDRDAAVIAEAVRHAQAAGRDVTYITDDMRRVGELPGTFDAVINMWQSLSYFDEETNIQVLREVHQMLRPGGRFIVDMYNREYFQEHQGKKLQEIDGISVESNGYLQGNRWHSVLTYRDAHGAVVGGDHMEWQLFTPDEFLALAARCGFIVHLVCTWADEDIPASPDVARMQIVLERDSSMPPS